MSGRDLSTWERLEPILEYALDLAPRDRAIYLESACGNDVSMRVRIEGIIAAGEDPNGLLERSIADVAGPLMLELDGPILAAITPGAMFGPWRVVRELGHGGMGEVFLAERADGQFAQTAALKLVRRGREHDPLLIRRFLEERRILASLTHPNVARLLDGGVTPANLPWFAMEYVAGHPLDLYCDEHDLDVPARLAIMEQVLGAVAYAHRNLLVHRDLKPSNIFVTEDGQAKLLDFGIAKLLGEENIADPGLTIGYNKVMTPEYAAPEQVRGEPITTATDIYALGAVMYELLTGQRAHRFDKRSAAEIEHVVCETEPELPSRAVRSTTGGRRGERERTVHRGSLSAELDTIVLKALQKDPLRRYASAEAMLEDLRRYRTGRPLLARPDSARYRWGKFISRHRHAVAAAVIIALVLAGGVAATVWQARAARLEAERADRVKEFLVDLLNEADPNITLGKEFSVRELLDRGAHRIDSMLGSEPGVQAELYEVLGNTYAHLGRDAQADTLHRKGLADVRRLYGPGSPEVLDEAMAVGWGLNDRGKYTDADTLLTTSIAEYRRAGGRDSQALSDAIDILATAKKRSDHPVEAESLYRQSLRMQIALTGPSDTITASRLSDLGALLGGQDRIAEADSALSAAQAHRRGVLAPLDVKYLVGDASLAVIRMKRGDFAGAEPLILNAVAGLERIRPDGLNLARTIDRLALLQSLEMHTTGAIATSSRASAMFAAAMGDDHPETLNSESQLAMYRANGGDAKGAEAGARAAYTSLRRQLGDRHDYSLAAGQRLASIELENGKHADASSLTTLLLASVRAKYGKIPPGFARLLGIEASLRASRGDSAAESEYRAALATLAGGTRVDSAALPSIVAHFAQELQARGKIAEAEASLRQTLAWLPPSADSASAAVLSLRAERRDSPPIQHASAAH
ncbi:MAG: serine/threonine protein kinase [Gemmatimonadota bacterium]|nr:serine/threonine protein kinase [Gemmatimonadota bacterium]